MTRFKFVNKIFQSLSLKSQLFQACFGISLFIFIFFLGWSKLSFLAGFLFAYGYMILFFYSVKLISQEKGRSLGFLLMGAKWIFIILGVFFASYFLQGKSFFLGVISATVLFSRCYVFENFKKFKEKTLSFDHSNNHKTK